MKKEKGLSYIGVIIIICIIVFMTVFTVVQIKDKVGKEHIDKVKSNMLLIQGATKVAKQNSIAKKTDDSLVGTKLSEIQDNEIIDNFKNLNIVEEGQYDKYYMITDEDLTSFNLEIKNEENAYYLVNYDESEVVITSGVDGKYKLSEIEKEEDNEVGDSEVEENEQQQEEKAK